VARKKKGAMTRRTAGLRNLRKANFARLGRRGEIKKSTYLKRV
jgi:hypothetical protein